MRWIHSGSERGRAAIPAARRPERGRACRVEGVVGVLFGGSGQILPVTRTNLARDSYKSYNPTYKIRTGAKRGRADLPTARRPERGRARGVEGVVGVLNVARDLSRSGFLVTRTRYIEGS